MFLKYSILGLINYSPMTGYNIDKIFKSEANYFWHAKTSQIYKELSTLSADGLVTSHIVEQVGRPDRKVYTITEKGRRELVDWLLEDHDNKLFEIKIPLLMKVVFGGNLSPEQMIKMFEKQKKHSEDTITNLDAATKHISDYSEQSGDKTHALYWEMTADLGKRLHKVRSEWTDDCIRKLSQLEKA